VAARVGEAARRHLLFEERLELAAHRVGPASEGKREALGLASHLLRKRTRDVDPDQETQVARGRRVVLPGTRGLEDGGALWHGDRAWMLGHVVLAVRDG